MVLVLPRNIAKELPQGAFERYQRDISISSYMNANKSVESMFDIEDWIDEDHWPEWKVTGYAGEYIVKAPDEPTAIKIAREAWNERRQI